MKWRGPKDKMKITRVNKSHDTVPLIETVILNSFNMLFMTSKLFLLKKSMTLLHTVKRRSNFRHGQRWRRRKRLQKREISSPTTFDSALPLSTSEFTGSSRRISLQCIRQQRTQSDSQYKKTNYISLDYYCGLNLKIMVGRFSVGF